MARSNKQSTPRSSGNRSSGSAKRSSSGSANRSSGSGNRSSSGSAGRSSPGGSSTRESSPRQSSLQSPGRTGGKDGTLSPSRRHSSAPSGRQKEPMVTQESPSNRMRSSSGSIRRDSDMEPPDEEG